MDTDEWHRRIGLCRSDALKQLVEELATETNDIIYNMDGFGVGKPTKIGRSPALAANESNGHEGVFIWNVRQP